MIDVGAQTGVSGGRLCRGGRGEITAGLTVSQSGCVQQPTDTLKTQHL